MALYKGSNKIAELYYHGVAVAEIYKGNILVWTAAAPEYLVTITQAANGTITAAPMQGPAGTLVTLYSTPNTGYQLTYYTVNGSQIQGNTFTLDSDSTISGQFTAITYTVTIGSHTNGTLSANPMSGTYGTTVTLSGTGNAGYTLDYYSVNGSRITGNTFTLTGNTTVAATYKQITYTVTIGSHTNGTLSASPASGTYGTTVTLSGTANAGYQFDYFTVNGSRISGSTFTLTQNTTVTAVYKVKTTSLLYLNKMDNTSLTASYNNVNMTAFNAPSNRLPTITNISAVDGNMPSSYIGQKYAKFSWFYTTSSCVFGSDSLTKFTIGFWFKNSSTAGADNNRYKKNAIGPTGILEAKSTDTSIYIGTYSGNPAFTGTMYYYADNGTTYDSTNKWYKTPAVNGNKWCYIAVVFDKTNSSQPVKWYVNGTQYLHCQPRSSSNLTGFFTYSNASSVYKTAFKYLAGGTTGTANCSSISEIAIYPGIVTAIPTAPLVPA